ncbi:MAG: FAD-dependent oxidoreductase [Burkholderiales bacterium]
MTAAAIDRPPPAAAAPRDRSPHVAVAGGGLLGMLLALRLAQAGHPVTLLEAAPQGGGLAGAQRIGGHDWDRFYHVVLLSDLRTRALLDELGLADRLRWGTTKTGFFTDGALHSMSDALEFLRFPPLGLLDKLRLGATIFGASRIRDGLALERTTAIDWLTRWSGERVVEKIWRPLLASKLGDNAPLASAAFIWAIIARMYAARRAGLKRELFGWIDGGYACVIDALQRALDAAGVRTLHGARVVAIEGDARGARATLADGRTVEADRLVSTLPVPVFAEACRGLPGVLRERLDGVVTQGIVCPSLLIERPLSPYYVTNVTDRWVPFTGVIEMTALVDPARFGGRSLVYLPIYLPQHARRWDDDDATVLDDCIGALERMYPHFSRAQVVDARVARARHVLAVPTVDYSARALPPMATGVPNVFLLSSAQIALGTLNVDETVGVVEQGLGALRAAFAETVR